MAEPNGGLLEAGQQIGDTDQEIAALASSVTTTQDAAVDLNLRVNKWPSAVTTRISSY